MISVCRQQLVVHGVHTGRCLAVVMCVSATGWLEGVGCVAILNSVGWRALSVRPGQVYVLWETLCQVL